MPAKFVTFNKSFRNKVAKTSDGLPSLGTWLARVRGLGHPLLTEAVEGIWAGREGRVALEMPGTKSMLVMGWYNSRVEWSYLS